ncbi:MAG TPA: OmpH family outer membrane protein, partial [Gemmatimonadaceae bacterium]|nr:OmpH family outer membrane protein [Gemmatimonadaceae bacterium]
MRGLIRAGVLALIVGAASASSASAQAAATPKFGFINSAAILAEAPGRAEAENRFKTEVAAYQAQLQRMSDSLQTMAASFDKEAPKLDSATRVSRAKVIQDRETAYQTRARDLDQQMQTRQAELIRPIMENLQKVIEQVRAEDGYAMIFDVASQTSVIVAADKSLDITPKVLARVKAAPAPKPTATGAVTPQPAGVT